MLNEEMVKVVDANVEEINVAVILEGWTATNPLR